MRESSFRFLSLAAWFGAAAILAGGVVGPGSVWGPSEARGDVFQMGDDPNVKNLEFVVVGDAGNAADANYGQGAFGAVAYTYQMGKYDVTAAQYCMFLNAVARQSDPLGLYNPRMLNASGTTWGCGIAQNGSPGDYTYSVVQGVHYTIDNRNVPVNFVSWGDAVRFANWLTNGQPTGVEGAGTTETGSYTLNGAIDDANLMGVTRNAAAKYVLPTEDEWYKGAYYKGGSKNAGYWAYPTKSNAPPSNVLSATGTNNANFFQHGYSDPNNNLTVVGAFAASPGPYGTFDMAGDAFQWDESRGGDGIEWAYIGVTDSSIYLGAWNFWSGAWRPSTEDDGFGFRVAEVPEPATVATLAFLSIFLAAKKRINRQRRQRTGTMRESSFRFLSLAAWFGAAAILAGGVVGPGSVLGPSLARADVFNMGDDPNVKNLEFVVVGDAGNAADANYGQGAFGAVVYTYQMGKYDVTAAQYCMFLNAVASQSDQFGLYDPVKGAWSDSCGIRRTGSPGSYTYALVQGKYTVDNRNFPVNYVTWGDAARFANWLTNGQPTAAEGVGTTETGSYTLNGAIDDANLTRVTRNAAAKYVIPTEDEWYKAAYYKGGSKNAGYWAYPTESNTPPSNVLSATGTNNANFFQHGYTDPNNNLTVVGAFAASPGPYGTYDMGGDVFQWDEANYFGYSHGIGGIGWSYLNNPDSSIFLPKWEFGGGGFLPSFEMPDLGFRLAEIPEPSTVFILASTSCFLLGKRRLGNRLRTTDPLGKGVPKWVPSLRKDAT